MIIKSIGKISLPFIAIAILASCGGKATDKVVLTPKSTSINGDLGDYFEVVQKDYPLSDDNILSVEIKRKEADFKFPVESAVAFGMSGNYHAGVGIELLDDAGPKLIKTATDTTKSGVYDKQDIVNLLKLRKGESGYLRWSIENPAGLKAFQLTSALEGSIPSPTIPENPGSVAPAKSVINWDKVLDDYEALVNQYISISKKAKNKDITALAEMPLVLGKANDVGTKIKKAKGDLTPEQWSRFISLQTKLAQATLS